MTCRVAQCDCPTYSKMPSTRSSAEHMDIRHMVSSLGLDSFASASPVATTKPLVESNSPRSRMSPELLLEVRLVRLARLRHPVDHLVEESGWVSDP